MFTRDTKGAPAAATTPVAGDTRNVNKPKQLSSLTRTASLSRSSLHTTPIAESTHIGLFGSPGPSIGASRGEGVWNGSAGASTSSSTGQFKRKPTSPLSNSRTLFKSSGNLSIFGRTNSQVYTDAQSPGLVNRLVRYYDREQSSGAMNRSHSLSSVYNKPGQFPVVHLRKQELRYGLGGRRKGNLSTFRIPPPEQSVFQVTKRSSILRTGSLLMPGGSETASYGSSPFGVRGTATVGSVLQRTAKPPPPLPTTAGPGCDESDVENRVITPCAEPEATPTRSVLDALKEISRKRINSEELDADRIKKQCKELSELDAAGSGPPSATAAVATGTLGLAAKRSREQASSPGCGSPSSPSDGSGGTIGAGEQQSLKKRFCSKNNDILSSLSSSLVAAHTPKQRVIAPRADRRLQLTVGSPSLSASLLSSMPTSSSTPLSEATAVPGTSGALRVDRELADAGVGADSGSGALQNAKTPPLSVPPWPHRTGPSASTDSPQPDHRVPPKITLFNRPYDAKASPKTAPRVTVTSDGEEDEGAEGGGRVQFVKPKEKSTTGISGSGGTASSDPLKKPPPSKLSVMLKCLSGDLGEDDDEEEEEVVQEVATMTPKTPQATAVSGSGTVSGIKSAFAFTAAKDTVDAPKESTAKSDIPTANQSPATATSTGDGISALLNNPIKDAGLGKTVTQQPEQGAVFSTPQKEVTPGTKTATAKPAEVGQKQVAFTFGRTPLSTAPATATTAATDAQGTNTLTSSAATVNSPVSPTTTSAASSTPAPAATFSFGTPTAKTSMASGAAPTPGNLISFSPAPGGFGAASNTSPMFGVKPTSPVVQFGAGTGATTTTAAPSQTPAPASLFTFGASASAAAGATSTTLAASATTPTFGGSTFSAFKSPLATASSASPSSTVPTTTTATATNAVGSGTFSAPPETTTPSTFSFGAVVSSSSTSAAPALPVFGSTAAPSTGSTFTFGGTVKPSVPTATVTPTATAASGAFTFGAVAKSTAPGAAAPSATSTSTFSFGGTPASLPASSSTTSKTVTNVPATFSFGGPKAAEATAATDTTNLFAASAPNVFGASLAASGNNPQSTAAPEAAPVAANLFAVASQTAQPATASAPSSASIFGGSTAGIPPAAGTNAPLPFTFGAKSTTPATASTALPNGQNLFASPPSGTSNTAASGAMFTFGSQSSNNSAPPNAATVAATNSAPQGAGNGTTGLGSTFGASSGLPNSNPTQPAATKPATFTFGATAKPSAPGSGIFGGQPPAFGATQSAVPTFGAGSGGGSIFGSGATNTGSAGATAAGNIFGSSTQPVNGAPNGPAAPSAPSGGALFTFGATNNANSGIGQGSATVGSTFGAPVAGNGNTFVLTNGLGSGQQQQQQQQQQQSQHPQQPQPIKPFTFGAGTVATGPTPGSTPGGFNFNLGSNVQSSPVAKPFAFGGGAAVGGTNAPGSNPPMFGAPQPQPSAGSPFTFGASNNTQQQAANTSGGPFAFGSTQPSGPAGGPPPNVVLPFSFSAGNVSAVAPQPQQRQQADGAPAPFTFNAAGRGPFGGVAGAPVGGAPTFGGAPVFGAPTGMPTFSIGTNSTPNGPPAGQRRIKTATRRIK
ncbi:putative nuclear envelope pore membrane protein POM 121B [Anopheles cruzii]|uniref:putative nuclear envelope pore membrane protein POM 121B n=1 Tax=Anopheles cruzii TaxID=68878 RepID=UPI0022EC19CD|nr:putative nuclear envelope pore membrane protein POM 121B [Anopheles cruzii]